jgi:hypothetical protein
MGDTSLEALADAIDTEFSEYRPPASFSDISLIIDTSSRDQPTLIVHLDVEDPRPLANEIEMFLQERGARTSIEDHGSGELRILAVTTE